MSSTDQTTRPGRVFIAEDDDQMRAMLDVDLTRNGFDVIAVRTGDELLERLERATDGHRPDAVITDVRMPGRDGLSVLAEIRRKYPEIPVLLITAFGERRVHERARQLGAAMVLDKPLKLPVLRDALHQATAS